jgi:hypothetical protein
LLAVGLLGRILSPVVAVVTDLILSLVGA